MSTSRHVLTCACLILAVGTSGCATIVSGRHEKVAIRSDPPKAMVAVHNEQGKMVAKGTTPMKVKLKRGRGIFKKPPHYTATFRKPGYQPSEVEIDPSFNPWTLGNLVLGGPIGLAADAASGAVWRMSPGEIHKNLTPLDGPMYSNASESGEVSQATFVSD